MVLSAIDNDMMEAIKFQQLYETYRLKLFLSDTSVRVIDRQLRCQTLYNHIRRF